MLAGGEEAVVDLVGFELPVDPFHHAESGDTFDVPRPGAVGEAVQGVQGGVTRSEGGYDGSLGVRGWCRGARAELWRRTKHEV